MVTYSVMLTTLMTANCLWGPNLDPGRACRGALHTVMAQGFLKVLNVDGIHTQL